MYYMLDNFSIGFLGSSGMVMNTVGRTAQAHYTLKYTSYFSLQTNLVKTAVKCQAGGVGEPLNTTNSPCPAS